MPLELPDCGPVTARPGGSMSISTETTIPAGTYTLDKVHSHVGFAVKHMVVVTFRGRFEEYDATLEVGPDGSPRLVGTVGVGSIEVKDENLAGHLQSPEFFDAEGHPELRFQSESIRICTGAAVVDRSLTIKAETRRGVAR